MSNPTKGKDRRIDPPVEPQPNKGPGTSDQCDIVHSFLPVEDDNQPSVLTNSPSNVANLIIHETPSGESSIPIPVLNLLQGGPFSSSKTASSGPNGCVSERARGYLLISNEGECIHPPSYPFPSIRTLPPKTLAVSCEQFSNPDLFKDIWREKEFSILQNRSGHTSLHNQDPMDLSNDLSLSHLYSCPSVSQKHLSSQLSIASNAPYDIQMSLRKSASSFGSSSFHFDSHDSYDCVSPTKRNSHQSLWRDFKNDIHDIYLPTTSIGSTLFSPGEIKRNSISRSLSHSYEPILPYSRDSVPSSTLFHSCSACKSSHCEIYHPISNEYSISYPNESGLFNYNPDPCSYLYDVDDLYSAPKSYHQEQSSIDHELNPLQERYQQESSSSMIYASTFDSSSNPMNGGPDSPYHLSSSPPSRQRDNLLDSGEPINTFSNPYNGWTPQDHPSLQGYPINFSLSNENAMNPPSPGSCPPPHQQPNDSNSEEFPSLLNQMSPSEASMASTQPATPSPEIQNQVQLKTIIQQLNDMSHEKLIQKMNSSVSYPSFSNEQLTLEQERQEPSSLLSSSSLMNAQPSFHEYSILVPDLLPRRKVYSSHSQMTLLQSPNPESKNVDSLVQTRSRKKENRVCVICGTTHTPKWRRSPPPQRYILCNACGLQYAKEAVRGRYKMSPLEECQGELCKRDRALGKGILRRLFNRKLHLCYYCNRYRRQHLQKEDLSFDVIKPPSQEEKEFNLHFDMNGKGSETIAEGTNNERSQESPSTILSSYTSDNSSLFYSPVDSSFDSMMNQYPPQNVSYYCTNPSSCCELDERSAFHSSNGMNDESF